MSLDGTQPARMRTGVPGLDEVLEGGLLQGGVYIVEGTPGAGKTILGNQICFHHASGGGRALYATLLAESHTRMIAHLRRMRFFRPELVPESVYYVSAFKQLESHGLDGLFKTLRETLTAQKASLLVLDGLVSAAESAESDRAFKKFVHELQILSGMSGCTVLLLSSVARSRSVQPEHTMVDGILQLTDELKMLRAVRRLQVLKLRGTDAVRGLHALEISDEGIIVRPRIETMVTTAEAAHITPGEGRMDFGVPALDEMLCGGLPSHSVTMVLGPSGGGKTILGLQFLAAGANKGERGLHFGFYERPRELLAKSERLGLGLERFVDEGLLHLVRHSPTEGDVDLLVDRLLTEVRERRVKRLFLDGIHAFQQATDLKERIRDIYGALSEQLSASGVTTVYSLETPDLFGPRIEVPIGDVSAITHNIIVLRHVEMSARLHRLISVLKLRDSDYDPAIREFLITDEGITVSKTFETAARILSGSAELRNGNNTKATNAKATAYQRAKKAAKATVHKAEKKASTTATRSAKAATTAAKKAAKKGGGRKR